MTSCNKPGIKIHNTGNDYKHDPFANINPFAGQSTLPEKNISVTYTKDKYETLDLNIDNYSREELYKLFGLTPSISLTTELMKEARKIVLKTHPDKSRLDFKYFLFFNKAYDKLYSIYDFQNKTTKKAIDQSQYYDSENVKVLDKMFNMKSELKDEKNFNTWFNTQFEKHRLEDPVEHGYGDWLKSDEDVIYTPQNINKDTMSREINKRKKEIQSLIPYSGVNSSFNGSSVGGSSLMEHNSNFSSNSLFGGGNNGIDFTDLRQAYVESVIPVTEEDYNKVQKFNSIDAYKRHRDGVDTTPLSKEEAMRQLFNNEKQAEEESAALAFYYAQQSEKAQKNNNTFWSGLKQLTNW